MSDRVTLSVEDGIASVRLSRPDKLNALDRPLLEALTLALSQLSTQPGLRVVVLSGEGKGFCAGLDVASLAQDAAALGALSTRTHGDANLFQHVAWGLRTLPVPVIAAIHGVAFGGGLQIASGADVRIATPDARLSVMEMKWGLVPDMAGVALWRTLVRDDVLRELTYTHRIFSGAEAVPLGFVTRVSDDPLSAAEALAREIADKNPHAVRAAKRLYNSAPDLDVKQILQAESREQEAILLSPNQLEAVAANLEKRTPKFQDP
jgi:enoyl-CoA hydratase/carnithine racemase